MLNGIDPVIIFNLRTIPSSLKDSISKIPVAAGVVGAVDLPAIPVYLSADITGIWVDTEDKSIEIDTKTETLSSGGDANIEQAGLANTIKIGLLANKTSPGIALLASLMDLLYNKATSKEYSITYLNGSITAFGCVLNSMSITQDPGATLVHINIELVKPATTTKKTSIPVVGSSTGTVPLL